MDAPAEGCQGQRDLGDLSPSTTRPNELLVSVMRPKTRSEERVSMLKKWARVGGLTGLP